MPFSIEILFADDLASSSVTATGEEIRLLTAQQHQSFGITDALLKNAVGSYLGKKPDDVYTGDSTPGNWYKSNSWEQVTVRLRPVEARIVSIDTNPIQLNSQIFKNKSSKPASFDVSIMQDVSDSVDSSWSNSISFGVTQSIDYGAVFVSGNTSISFQADFQTGGSKSRTVSIGTSSGVMVDLDPGESVTATLMAAKGTMKVSVKFEAYLTGVIAAHYVLPFRYKHVVAADIAAALESIGQSHRLYVTNEIHIDSYSSGEVVLNDPLGRRIRFRALKIPHLDTGCGQCT